MKKADQILDEIRSTIEKNGRCFLDSSGNVKEAVNGIAINWHSMFLPEDLNDENMDNLLKEIDYRLEEKYADFNDWYSSAAD